MCEINDLVQLGSIETPDELDNIYGYRVYSGSVIFEVELHEEEIFW